MNQPVKLLVAIVLSLPALGCERSLETGVVTGVITKDGKPLSGVMVYYLPDPEKQTEGKHSTAITDDQGRYQLTYYGESRLQGAVVGWHRVTLEDMAPQNFRGKGAPPPSRVPEALSEAWQTPLAYEIKPGEQEINIDVAQVRAQPRNLYMKRSKDKR